MKTSLPIRQSEHPIKTKTLYLTTLIAVYGLGVLTGDAQEESLQPLKDNKSPQTLDESSVLWKLKKGVPKKSSLQLVGEHLYAVSDGGIGTCWDAKSGEAVWTERIGGNYSASPLVANGRIYFFSEEGKTVVIKVAPTYEVLAENTIGDGFMASPAVSGDALYLRSRTHLYCIQK